MLFSKGGFMVDNNTGQVIKAGATTYFFDIKQSKNGKPFLVITESRFKGEEGKHQRSSIVVFPEHLLEFLKILQKSKSSLIHE